MVNTLRVGVLSLQGDFARHRASLEPLGIEVRRITMPYDMDGIEALILPGGESTTMLRLLESTGLREPVGAFVRERPVLGTCAGLILLGHATGALPHPTFDVLDVDVERNAYGRQVHSFIEPLESSVLDGPFQGVFIRAPRIRRVGRGVDVVVRRADGEPVGVQAGAAVGLSFHPELTSDSRLHRWFLGEIANLPLPDDVARGAVQGGAS